MFFNFVFKGMLVFVYHYPVMSQLQPCFLELCRILPVQFLSESRWSAISRDQHFSPLFPFLLLPDRTCCIYILLPSCHLSPILLLHQAFSLFRGSEYLSLDNLQVRLNNTTSFFLISSVHSMPLMLFINSLIFLFCIPKHRAFPTLLFEFCFVISFQNGHTLRLCSHNC